MSFFPVSSSIAERPPMRQQGRLRLLGLLMIPAVLLVGFGFSAVLIDQPVYGAALVVAIAGLYCFFQSFETTVVGILCLRSFLDFYSTFQVPAAFALGVDLLVLLYVACQWIERKPVHTDPFWWFLIAWVTLQGIWVALLPTTALGGTSYMAYEALREWIRFFSLAMVYLLVMQLRDRIPPERLASLLFISLIIPMIFALLQSLPIELPSFLQSNVGWKTSWKATEDRVTSTLGHYNSFATFSLLFMALGLWRVQMAKRPLGWLLLVAGTMYCLIATKSLTGLVMMLVFIGLYFLPKLKGKGILGAIAIGVVLFFVLTSDLAQSRLVELDSTPLLNGDLSFKRAIALQAADVNGFRNSFNWRLLQWRGLLLNWQMHPWLGYGLASAKKVSEFGTTSHNDYVRFLVEEGLLGLSLFLLFLAAQVARIVQIMRRSLPGSPQRALSQTMLAFAIAMIVGMAAGNVMVHTATFFYWWTLMALLGWSSWPARFGESAWVAASGSLPDGGDNGYGFIE
ncbi:MAG: O-antigen ligase family protein, partial [Cyanobacteria bacterium J06598_3]